MPTSGDLKSGDSLFFTTPSPEIQWTPSSPPPPFHNPDKCGNDLGHYNYKVLQEVHTIKIRDQRFHLIPEIIFVSD